MKKIIVAKKKLGAISTALLFFLLMFALVGPSFATVEKNDNRESRKEIRNVMQAAKAKHKQAARGAVVYKAYCVLCHGAEGGGSSRMNKLHSDVSLKISNLSSAEYDEIIREGGAALGRSEFMPGWKSELTQEQIDDVVVYLALLNDPVRRGEVVFKTNCILCHGLDGTGQGRASSFFDPPPADLTQSDKNSDYKKMIITQGGKAMGRSDGMPVWGDQLSEQEIDDVVAYVDTLSILNGNAGSVKSFVSVDKPGQKQKRKSKRKKRHDETQSVIHSAKLKANQAQRGGLVYKAYCVLCHGAQGKGSNRMKRLHSDLQLGITKGSPEYYETIIRGGGGAVGKSEFMPIWNDELTQEQIDDVVVYLSLLNDSVQRGEVVFKTNCVLCHGVKGDGKGRAAVLFDPPPADLTRSDKNEDYKRMIVTLGGAALGRSSMMPQWGLELDEKEIDDVVNYLGSILVISTPE